MTFLLAAAVVILFAMVRDLRRRVQAAEAALGALRGLEGAPRGPVASVPASRRAADASSLPHGAPHTAPDRWQSPDHAGVEPVAAPFVTHDEAQALRETEDARGPVEARDADRGDEPEPMADQP
ncbi:MAG: hypothetical protein ABW128_06230, partial [Rhizorhabdus sp.]